MHDSVKNVNSNLQWGCSKQPTGTSAAIGYGYSGVLGALPVKAGSIRGGGGIRPRFRRDSRGSGYTEKNECLGENGMGARGYLTQGGISPLFGEILSLMGGPRQKQ